MPSVMLVPGDVKKGNPLTSLGPGRGQELPV